MQLSVSYLSFLRRVFVPMDEQINNQRQDTPNEDTHLIATERHHAHENGHTPFSPDSNTALELPQFTSPSKLAVKRYSPPALDLFAIRRTRLNRLLMRKRRQERDGKDF